MEGNNVGERMFASVVVLSLAGLMFIATEEDFRGEAYLDAAGVPTIGYGHTEDVRMGDRITREKAIEHLHRDISYAGDAIKSCVTVPLYQHEYDAYSSLAYNIGGSAFCKSTLVKKLNSEDYTGACAEILRWVYVGKKPVNGLKARREKESKMCIGEN